MDRRDKILIPVVTMSLASMLCFGGEYSVSESGFVNRSNASQLALSQVDNSGKPDDLPIVRADRFAINYSLDPDSLKYISRVELWCGRDVSGAWQLYDYDLDRTPPVDFQATSEGVWRFLVVPVDVNGVRYYQGSEKVLDKKGAIPATIASQTAIFVDYTPPQIFLHNPILQTGANGTRQIVLQWNVFDSFPGDYPVELYWIESGSPVFQSVGQSFKAFDGFIWLVPPQVVKPVCFKLVGRDKAGNIQEKVTGLIDVGGADGKRVTTTYISESYGVSGSVPSLSGSGVAGLSAGPMSDGTLNSDIKTGNSQPQAEFNPETELKSQPDFYVQPAVNEVAAGELMKASQVSVEQSPPEKLTGRALDYLQLGHDAYQRGEYERARMLYEQVLAIEPNYTLTRYHLADVLYLQGKFEMAQSNFEIFLKRYPEHRKALLGLMYCHLKLGNYPQAKDILENKLKQINNKQQWDDLFEK